MSGTNLKKEDFLTSKDVCRLGNFSVSVLNRLEQTGELVPARKLPTNNRRLYLKKDVDKFFESITTK